HKTVKGYVSELMNNVEQMREKAKIENELVNSKAYAFAADPTEGLKLPTRVDDVPFVDFSPILNALTHLEKSAQQAEQLKANADAQKLAAINAKIYAAEQSLLMTKGLPRRPWYKHSLYAPGFYTGYGVKTIPGVREAIEQKDWSEASIQIEEVAAAINRLATYLEAL
ncbi:MAG: transferrin receptor-like dimerization domain-containing protein, partial [Sphingomonadales bacterium]